MFCKSGPWFANRYAYTGRHTDRHVWTPLICGGWLCGKCSSCRHLPAPGGRHPLTIWVQRRCDHHHAEHKSHRREILITVAKIATCRGIERRIYMLHFIKCRTPPTHTVGDVLLLDTCRSRRGVGRKSKLAFLSITQQIHPGRNSSSGHTNVFITFTIAFRIGSECPFIERLVLVKTFT